MKKRIAALLVLTTILTAQTAFAWESHDVDFSKVQVTVDNSNDQTNTPSAWAADEVKTASDKGLIPTLSGNTTYQNSITRLQFCELVVNMTEKALGKQLTTGTNPFKDTSSTVVLKAYNAGVVKGLKDTTFAPNALITREAIATMFYRAITYIQTASGKSAMQAGVNLSAYTDAAQVSSWAADSVKILAANNIMKGTSTTTLAPKTNCSIEQAIILVLRAYNAVTA